VTECADAKRFTRRHATMRLMYWTPLFSPDIGGIETLSAILLPRLQESGHKIVVVTSHGSHLVPDESNFHGIPVYRFHFRSVVQKGNPREVALLRRQIAALKKSFQPEVVHLHVSDPSGYFHLSTAQTYPAATLVTFHQSWKIFGLAGGPDTLVGKLLRQSDWVTAVSRTILEEVRAFDPDIRGRSSVIYNGLAAPSLKPAPLPFDPPCILYLGRLVAAKRVELALEAFAKVVKGFPVVRLVIAGDGIERTRLEEQAAALQLQERVEFRGLVEPENVPELLNQATLLLMASPYEGFPLAALEAMQMGRPVVTTAGGGVSEAVIDGQTGLVTPSEDSRALAEAVCFLLEHPDRAKEMGEAGRRRQLEMFSLENTAREYDALYQQIAHRAC
jgi:glycogen(starch) synthase